MNALIIGGGSGTGFGIGIVYSLLNTGFNVYSISGSTTISHENFYNCEIKWNTLSIPNIEPFLHELPALDFILFNQNGSSLTTEDFSKSVDTLKLWKLEENWKQTYFTSCILPYHIIKTLNKQCADNTRIAWMLSQLTYDHDNLLELKHADYISNKYQNLLLMKNFAMTHPSCFFGIVPSKNDNISDVNPDTLVSKLLNIPVDELNGSVRSLDITVNEDFDIFTANKRKKIIKQKYDNDANDANESSIFLNKDESEIELEFNIGEIDGKSMCMEIDNNVYSNLYNGFKYSTSLTFPNVINITLSGKGKNDTIIDDNGNIIDDKFIQLTKLIVDGIPVDEIYLKTHIILHTDDNMIVKSNYWGFNGKVTIEFNEPNAFLWLIHTQNAID